MGGWQSKATPATSSGWSSLPPELLDLVLRRLSSVADRLRFSAVCRHWLDVATGYSAPTLPPVLPWLLNFHDDSLRSVPDGETHTLRNRFRNHAVCVIGSCGRWLLLEEPRRWDRPTRWRRHFLLSPLRPRTTNRLRLIRLPGHCREPVHVNPHDGYYAGPPPDSRSASAWFSIFKVIVCSTDLVVAHVNYGPSSSEVVVCCRPGMSSSSWSTGICDGRSYLDTAFYRGKVYTVTREGDLFAHEVTMTTEESDDGEPPEPRLAQAERVIQAPPTLDGSHAALLAARKCYLVIPSGSSSAADNKLLMVRWIVPLDHYTCHDSTRHMTLKVFEADFEMSRWVEVKSLDDQVLFVSSNSSRAISVSTASHQDCQGGYLPGNKIYFVDDDKRYWRLWQYWGPSEPRNCGVYDMSSGTIQPISLGGKHIHRQLEASWFFPHD